MAQIETVVLENEFCQVRLLNLGCITQSWRLAQWPQDRSAVLGYADAQDYTHNPHFLGAIIGRVANRISGAGFDLHGTHHALSANEGQNTLHGGASALSNRIWTIETATSTSVRFSLKSADGDQGFPSAVLFKVTVTLQGASLLYDMTAQVDNVTPISMTQHNYYNLNGTGTILNHCLCIPSQEVLASDDAGLPTQIVPVNGTAFDFRAATQLTSDHASVLDTAYCLSKPPTSVTLTNGSGCHLNLETHAPSLQVYAARKLTQDATPFGTQNHKPFAGLCLEPQGYPNAVNRPEFPSILVTPDTPYRNRMRVTLTDTGAL